MGRWLAAILRFLSFGLLRNSESINEAANAQFTGSASDIRAGYAIERDNLAKEFRTYKEAVSGVLLQVEQKRAELNKLDEEERRLQVQLNGALAAAEAAPKGSDDYTRAQSAYERFKGRIEEIDARQERLHSDVASLEVAMKRHMSHLTEMQARLERLPQEEAETISEFVSSKAIIALNERLMNAQDSLKEGPVSTIRAKVANLSANARITEKLAGTDVKFQDDEYARLGKEAEAGDSFEAVLAARKAQRDGVKVAPQVDAPVAVPERPRP